MKNTFILEHNLHSKVENPSGNIGTSLVFSGFNIKQDSILASEIISVDVFSFVTWQVDVFNNKFEKQLPTILLPYFSLKLMYNATLFLEFRFKAFDKASIYGSVQAD